MAIFSFSTPFTFSALNFHASYGPASAAVSAPGTTFSFPEIQLALPGGTVTVPGAELAVPELVAVFQSSEMLLIGGDGLNATVAGLPRGGTVSYLSVDSPNLGMQALGLSIRGRDFAAAARSEATNNDQALIRAQMAGNDLVHLSGGNDEIDSGAGRDLISGGGGDDVLKGAVGNDLILGEGGNDSAYGGLGNDLLLDFDGANYLSGGAGRDVLMGGAGKDTLVGGAGADMFVFTAGNDVVRDFADGADRIIIIQTGVTFADLTFQAVSGGTKVMLAGSSILLNGVDPGMLTKADFMLGKIAPVEGALTDFFDGWSYF